MGDGACDFVTRDLRERLSVKRGNRSFSLSPPPPPTTDSRGPSTFSPLILSSTIQVPPHTLHTMPTVLITGLNGFLAVHTALELLSHGWSVRGTVRSSAKAENTKKLPSLSKYVADGRVELVVVEDLIKGDFTEALKGIDAVS